LAQALNTRVLPLPTGKRSSPTAAKVSGRKFALESNVLGITDVALTFKDASCVFALNTGKASYKLLCGLTGWADDLIDLPGEPPALLPRRQGGPVKVAVAGAWSSENTFVMRWHFYETPHHDTVTFKFEGSTLHVQFLNSITAALGANQSFHPETRPELQGTLI
jgi:hypothetical protein